MDASHLNPSAYTPHHANQDPNEFRATTPVGRDIHVEVKPDRSPHALAPAPSNLGATLRKPRKSLVLCFDGTGEPRKLEKLSSY